MRVGTILRKLGKVDEIKKAVRSQFETYARIFSCASIYEDG